MCGQSFPIGINFRDKLSEALTDTQYYIQVLDLPCIDFKLLTYLTLKHVLWHQLRLQVFEINCIVCLVPIPYSSGQNALSESRLLQHPKYLDALRLCTL